MDKILGIVRHAVTTGGGVMVALGVSNTEQVTSLLTNVETFVGSGMVIAGIAASIASKAKVKWPWGRSAK